MRNNNHTVSLIAVGDIFLKTKNVNDDPFRYIKSFLNKDFIFGNLEVVLSNKGVRIQKRVVLKTYPDRVNYLINAGFNIVNIANNHILDYGVEGYKDTLDILDKKEICYIGTPKQTKYPYKVVEKNGVKIGFLGYSGGDGRYISKIDEKEIIKDINNLKGYADIIIISLHWGVEYFFYPMPDQQKLARNLIEAGADIILGHHPHVVQGIEKYQKGIAIYSLGNFQFGIELAKDFERTNESFIIEFELSKRGVENYKIIPIKINENYQPIELAGKEKEDFLCFIETISKPLPRNEISENKWFEEYSKIYIKNFKLSIGACIFKIKNYGIKHLLYFIIWLISPFCIKCYIGIIRSEFKKFMKNVANAKDTRYI